MSADTTAPDPTPVVPSPPGEQTPSKEVRWPGWFPAFDLALGVTAVVLAFLTASFVARNSDVWRHLATGRLIVQGNYPFGQDPFTFTAADRVWVNPNWLTEVGSYALYSMDPSGAVLVAVKAMAFAAAFGLVLLLRRPNAPLWPWAVSLAVGAIAACSQAQLRPLVVGLLLQAVVLVVLFRGNWATGNRWRMPLALGGVTAAWANLDSFAFLAPLTVALLLVGELVHNRLLAAVAADPDDPFPSVPPVPALGRALAAAIVGLLLNPTFLVAAVSQPAEAVAQLLPFELDFETSSVLQREMDDLGRLTYSALNRSYTKNPIMGDNPTGYAALLLTAAAAVLSAVGYRAGRASHLAVWIGFVALAALVHHRFLPFLAVVSVPYVAAHLNGLSRQLARATPSPQLAQTLMVGSRIGRVVTLVGLIILALVAVPGWLQARIQERAHARWVAWGVEADDGMTRAGELIQGWRTEQPNRLGGVRGLCTSPEFGDCLCWTAPAEKSYITSRYRLHRADLEDLILFRTAVYGRKGADAAPTAIVDLARKHDAAFVCVGQSWLPLQPAWVDTVRGQFDRDERLFSQTATGEILWHLDGRVAVLGRTDTPAGLDLCRRMEWDVTRQAFGPSARKADQLPELAPGSPPPEGWEYEYFARPATRPIELDDARWFGAYTAQRQEFYGVLNQQRGQVWQELFPFRVGGATGLPGPLVAALRGPSQVPLTDHDFALPIVANRVARRAIVLKPDEPDGYLAFGRTIQLRLTPDAAITAATRFLTGGADGGRNETRQQAITALTRGLARMPEVVEGVAVRDAAQALDIRMNLFRLHLSGADINLDVARRLAGEMDKIVRRADRLDPKAIRVETLWLVWWDALGRATGVPANDPRTLDQRLEMLQKNGLLDAADHPSKWKEADSDTSRLEFVAARFARLEAAMKEVERRMNDTIEPQLGPRRLVEKAEMCAQIGLPKKGIDLILEAGDKAKGQSISRTDILKLVELLQRVGRLEEAAVYRRKLDEDSAGTPDPTGELTNLRLARLVLEFNEANLAGDYRRGDELLEQVWKNQSPRQLPDGEKKLAANPLAVQGALYATPGTGGAMAGAMMGEAVRKQLMFEAVYWCRRGLFALYEGDAGRAKRMFDAAAEPQGVKLTDLRVPSDLSILSTYLPRYRALLDKYAR